MPLAPAGSETERDARERLAAQLDYQADVLEMSPVNSTFKAAAVMSLRDRAAALRRNAPP